MFSFVFVGKLCLLCGDRRCCYYMVSWHTHKHTQLSLRENPLVVRFVQEISLNPPSLMELAARVIRTANVPYGSNDLPFIMRDYLDTAHCCVNPKCQGKRSFESAFLSPFRMREVIFCIFFIGHLNNHSIRTNSNNYVILNGFYHIQNKNRRFLRQPHRAHQICWFLWQISCTIIAISMLFQVSTLLSFTRTPYKLIDFRNVIIIPDRSSETFISSFLPFTTNRCIESASKNSYEPQPGASGIMMRKVLLG